MMMWMRLIGSFVTLLSITSAADFCAVKLRVVSSDGKEPLHSQIPIYLLDAKGDAVSQTSLDQGYAEFCDFGFGLHSILIGKRDDCGSVEIKNIRYQWLQPQMFVAIVNRCVGQGEGWIDGCFVYFRVVDSGGKIIPHPTAVRADQVSKGSKYGFIPTGLPRGASGSFEISAKGFQSKTVDLNCDKSGEIERTVTLNEMRRQ